MLQRLNQSQSPPIQNHLPRLPARHHFKTFLEFNQMEPVGDGRLEVKAGFEHDRHFVPGLIHLAAINAFDRQHIEHDFVPVKRHLLGGDAQQVPFDWNKLVFNMLTIKGIYGREMYKTGDKMTVMLETGLNLKPAITHRFHLIEFEKGFEVMTSGKAGKVILNWR